MTYTEYVTAMLGKFGLSVDDVAFILFEAGLTGSDTVATADDKTAIKTAIYNQIPLMIAGLSDVTEGGYSIKWNIEGLKLWYSSLAKELGLTDEITVKPAVKDASQRW